MTNDERQVQQVLAEYVRAVDSRDGNAVRPFFSANARIEVFYNNPRPGELIGKLSGKQAIGRLFPI